MRHGINKLTSRKEIKPQKVNSNQRKQSRFSLLLVTTGWMNINYGFLSVFFSIVCGKRELKMKCKIQ